MRCNVLCASKFVAVICVLCIGGWPAAAQTTTATWVGAGGGFGGDDLTYNDPNNWDIQHVPIDGGGGTFLSATGTGSTLNLASLQSIDNLVDFVFAPVRTISATNGGAINLSALQSLQGGIAGGDRLDIVVNTGGTIDLTSLQSITNGNVRFVTEASNFSLGLTSAVGASFSLPNGSTLNLNSLVTQSGSVYDLPTSDTVNLAQLTMLNSTSVTISDGSSSFSAPNLTNIDNSRFILSGGATLTVAATTYDGTGIDTGTIFSADGAGTDLNLSALTSFDNMADFCLRAGAHNLGQQRWNRELVGLADAPGRCRQR